MKANKILCVCNIIFTGFLPKKKKKAYKSKGEPDDYAYNRCDYVIVLLLNSVT